ncbi:MAG: hypothetical protein HQL51_01380 [Magnetococcales bacterium]|nr:hypothetical protein [Magnetococcales bacterium]
MEPVEDWVGILSLWGENRVACGDGWARRAEAKNASACFKSAPERQKQQQSQKRKSKP